MNLTRLRVLIVVILIPLSLVALGGVMTSIVLMGKTVRSWERSVEVQAFIDEAATVEQTRQLQRTILALPGVLSANYISKEAALQEFKDLNSESSVIYGNLEKDALPASFRVTLKDPRTAGPIAARVEKLPGVAEVNSGGEGVTRLLTITKFIQAGSLLLVLTMVAFGVLILIKRVPLVYA